MAGQNERAAGQRGGEEASRCQGRPGVHVDPSRFLPARTPGVAALTVWMHGQQPRRPEGRNGWEHKRTRLTHTPTRKTPCNTQAIDLLDFTAYYCSELLWLPKKEDGKENVCQ